MKNEMLPLAPLYITMHDADNVAIVANDGGLPAGTVFPSGLTLVDKVPQAHKVALVDIPEGGEVRRYNVPIGYALKAIPARARRTTTIQGGALQTVSSRKPASAITKSRGPSTALVQTGSYRAAPRMPTTEALAPRIAACAAERPRSPSQNGSMSPSASGTSICAGCPTRSNARPAHSIRPHHTFTPEYG